MNQEKEQKNSTLHPDSIQTSRAGLPAAIAVRPSAADAGRPAHLLIGGLLAVVLSLAPAAPAQALYLCVKVDRATGEPRDGAAVKARSACRTSSSGVPIEVALSPSDLGVDLSGYATTSDFDGYVTTSDLDDYATTSDLGDYARADTVEVNAAAIASLETNQLPCATQVGTDVFFDGCNVRIRNGLGATFGSGPSYAPGVNGLGNLIVGYDEADSGTDKTGSHNLVVGALHSYTGAAGFVAGLRNTVWGSSSSVLGGSSNRASMYTSTVSGGLSNTASAWYSSVVGGRDNTSSAIYSIVP